jgi:hypothetical protein|tara:strand:- start:68 stop:271 length:204 start_codon:yes stop_codon:yes gene_type:complete
MSLELLKGYFYNSDGDLITWYEGYGDLDNIEDLLLYRSPCIGFVSTNKSYDTKIFKYDIETQTMVEK